MPTEDELKDAYKDGKAAYQDGLPITVNPYMPRYSHEGLTWEDSWRNEKTWSEKYNVGN
tara:strand:- start:413 stop:589 length:177 start_codon:yes stop_codon:yes gene_type:complete